MNINEYLEEIQLIDTKIANKQYEVDMWKEIAKGTAGRSEGERVQSSANQQKTANAVAKYVDIEREIEALNRERALFIKRIERLKKNQYNVMHDVYIKGMTLRQSALSHMKKSTWSSTIHKLAKKELQKIIEGEKDVQ